MTPEKQKKEQESTNSLRPLIMIGGFFLLGIALSILLFGGSLFDRGGSGSDELQQISLSEGIESGEIPVPASGAPLNVGDTAHNFGLADLDGNQVTLADFRGRPVVVNFWATWCPPCRLEMPEFQEAYETYSDQELAILAVNEAEPAAKVRAFFYDEMGFTFTPLLDSDSAVGEMYGAVGLPATFFINEQGEVAAIHRGLLTGGQLERYLEKTIN